MFEDIFDDFDKITEPEKDEWDTGLEADLWDTGANEDIWRSTDPSAIWVAEQLNEENDVEDAPELDSISVETENENDFDDPFDPGFDDIF